MLLAIVKGRYGETSTLLAVTGIAANIHFRAAAGIEAGFGVGAASLGENLITGSVAYEENPTITYSPISSARYIRQLLAPLPLDILVLALRTATFKYSVLTLMVNRVNDLRNPDFLLAPSADPDLRFTRFIEVFSELSGAGVLDMLKNPSDKSAFNLLVRGSTPQYYPSVLELLALLDLPAPKNVGKDIIIPIYLAVAPNKSWSVRITTRSTFDLIEILRAAVVVPEEHVQAGLTIAYPPMGLPGQGVRINSSTSKPKGNLPSVKFRGYWFSIGETDQTTKAAFNMLRTMWSISLSGAADESQAPMLTIPVGR